MKVVASLFAAVVAACGVLEADAMAHFKLLSPPPALIEDSAGGPDQKSSPCGTGQNSNVVTPLQAGQTVTLKWQETVVHPGHFRIALALKGRNELKDPVAKIDPLKNNCDSATIESPVLPILADGVNVHTEAQSEVGKMWEATVTIPANVTCDKCTLQVVQFMAEHAFNNPGGYSYHHCAELQITADPKKPIDKGWPAER